MTITVTAANRSVARKALAALLQGALVGTGLPVEAVYDYQVADFGVQSPVVVVTSAGSDPIVESERNVYFDIHTFVAYSAADANNVILWTEEQSEDTLDLVEQMITSVIQQNSDLKHELSPAWTLQGIVGRSQMLPIVISGIEYRHEVITVGCTLPNIA